MLLFSKKREAQELRAMQQSLQLAFANVKQDVQSVASWMQLLYDNQGMLIESVQSSASKLSSQEALINHAKIQIGEHANEVRKVRSEIEDLRKLVREIPHMQSQLKQLVDYYYSNEKELRKIKEIDSEVISINAKLEKFGTHNQFGMAAQIGYLSEIKELRQKVDQIEKTTIPKRMPLRERLIKKITQRSKEYVKNLLVSYIRKYEQISALKLREMIVEEQGIASKSSFYRILDELEALE